MAESSRNSSGFKANMNDTVLFTKNGKEIVGTVINVRENSVVIEMNSEVAVELEVENARTVLNHRNYKIIQRSLRPYQSPKEYEFNISWYRLNKKNKRRLF